jgi:hypothetical protein
LIAGKTKRRTRRQIEFAIVRRHEVQPIGPPMIAKAVTMSRAFVLRSARAKIIRVSAAHSCPSHCEILRALGEG